MSPSYARFPGYTDFLLTEVPRPGFDILDIIQSDVIESCMEAIGVAQPVATSGGYSSSAMVMDGVRKFVVRRPFFLMGRRADDAVQEARQKEATTAAAWAGAITDLSTSQKAQKAALDDLGAVKARLSDVTAECVQHREAREKLERDLAKLRRVFGERALTDALALGAMG